MTKKLKPLFKWMGGKSRYLNRNGDKLIVKDTKKFYDLFCGGASVAIWAYNSFPQAEIHLSDTNKFVIGLYEKIKTNPEGVLCEYLKIITPYLSMERTEDAITRLGDSFCKKESPRYKYYYQTRRKLYELYQASPDNLGSDFYATQMFLMKTSFGGAWQTTEEFFPVFATPCGFLNETISTLDMKERVKDFSRFLNDPRVFLYNLPYSEVLVDKTEGSYVFLDPPYLSTIQKYSDKFDEAASVELCNFMEALTKEGVNVVMTNTANPLWEENLKSFHNLEDKVSFTGGAKAKESSEVTLTNFKIC